MADITFQLETGLGNSVERIRRLAEAFRKVGDALNELADVLAETPAPQKDDPPTEPIR